MEASRGGTLPKAVWGTSPRRNLDQSIGLFRSLGKLEAGELGHFCPGFGSYLASS